MLIVEIVAGALVAALAMVMALCGLVGLLGILGAVRFVRCSRCGHMGLRELSSPLRSCVHCRHGWVLHPLYQLHHAHVGPPPLRPRDARATAGRHPWPPPVAGVRAGGPAQRAQ